MVAAAQQSVGFTDHLQELQDRKLAPVAALGLEPGSDPHVSGDCRILSTRLAPGGSGAKEVRLWDPAKATSTTVAADPAIVSAAWGPDGQQLLLADAKKGTTLAVVELPDLTKTRNVGASEVGAVWDAAWLPAG